MVSALGATDEHLVDVPAVEGVPFLIASTRDKRSVAILTPVGSRRKVPTKSQSEGLPIESCSMILNVGLNLTFNVVLSIVVNMN